MTLKIFASEINILPFFLRYITISKQQYWYLQARTALLCSSTMVYYVRTLWTVHCSRFSLHSSITTPVNFRNRNCSITYIFIPLIWLLRTLVSKHRYSSTDREVLVGSRMFHWSVSSLPGASSVLEDSFEIHGKTLAVPRAAGDVQTFPGNRQNSQ